ncbi:MAG: FISUMP domain-containing protein [Candidatus Gracilibacteria bacterium]|nr:FISUMP domain-containing protein [Candidatus Gracilibacteria bacterium]
MQKNNKAFTLVELIVVITILAILGTIAFINLQGYSISARDGKRVSDINNIMKKIGIESSKGTSLSTLITTTKTNLGLTINGNTGSSIQGTANFANLKEDGSKFKDPVTKGDYVLSYSVGGSGTGAYKFNQVSTVNEEENTAVVKGNYYKMQPSDSPSITYNSDDTFFVVDGGVDLPYTIVAGAQTTSPVVTWLDLDSNCDIPDLPIGTQVWAGCNSTLGTGFEYSLDVDCYDYQGNSTTGCNRPSNEKENLYNPTYGVNNIWGKLYTWANSPSACPAGRHVPSDIEWTVLTDYLTAQNGDDYFIGWAAQSGKNETNNLVKALKIPLAGYRWPDGSQYVQRGYSGYLWSSTQDPWNSTEISVMNILYAYTSVYMNTSNENSGYSVRCIKG